MNGHFKNKKSQSSKLLQILHGNAPKSKKIEVHTYRSIMRIFHGILIHVEIGDV